MVDELAHLLHDAIDAEVPAYRRVPEELKSELFDSNRLHVVLYFRCLAEHRAPSKTELHSVSETVRRRVHQAVPFDAMYRSYQVGTRLLWSSLVDRVGGEDLADLGNLALTYADQVTSAASSAYLQERERSARSQRASAELFLRRLVNDDLPTDEEATLREASALGYDLTRTHVAAMVATVGRQTMPEHLLALERIAGGLGRYFINGPTAVLPSGLVVAVDGDSVDDVSTMLRACIQDAAAAPSAYRVGIGAPHSGLSGLVTSFAEARRAHMLGSLLEPASPTHRYDLLRTFDFLKPGDSVEAYVNAVLAPLIDADRGKPHRLLETLETLFAVSLNRKVAAHRLGIHPNTISYRLQRIEKLLGGSFLSGDFCFRLQLAIKLIHLVPTLESQSE
jgi:sugar diacid utilization regulator